MKRMLFAAAILTSMAALAGNTRIELKVPQEAVGSQIIVYSSLYGDEEDAGTDTLTLSQRSMVIEVPEADTYYNYTIRIGDDAVPDLYINQGETARVEIKGLSPFDYTVTGSPLIEGIAEYNALTEPIRTEFISARENGAPREALEKIYERYLAATRQFIDKASDAPAAIYALAGLEDDDYLEYYDRLKANIDNSLFKDYIDRKRDMIVEYNAKMERQAAMTSGNTTAPDFTLKNLDGRDVSLSEFRGKWVVLDFWGSWCIWCIKGFPELKENYAKYAGQVEVIGIDCGDTPEKWREAVKKYELPWVNVYNPQGENSIDRAYGVQGFPTKVIVTPEGKIADITTGEDPAFYTKLASLVKSR